MNYRTVLGMVKTMLLTAVMAVIVIAMLVMATLQQSYRMCPPSEAELQDNLALSIYVEGE